MTDYAIVEDGKVARVLRAGAAVTGADGAKHPATIWTHWSPEELAAKLGGYPIAPAEIPAGKRASAPLDYMVEVDELTGVVTVSETVALEDAPPPAAAPKPLPDDCTMPDLLARLRALRIGV